jgi:hypothetical protein
MDPMRLVQRHGRIDRIGSEHLEVFIRCFFPDQQLEAMLGLEERLQRKLRQAAASVGVGEVLPGFASRDVNFTETREEIARLRREEAAWMHNADPINLTRPVPKVMHAAASLIRKHGSHLGDRQDELIERLEAPYAPRVQRAVRGVLNDGALTRQGKADKLLILADQLGLARQPGPQPLPQIEAEDIRLICWIAVVPTQLSRHRTVLHFPGLLARRY